MTTETLTRRDVTGYRSGTAARLTGIPVETLRVWERRYKVVGPKVSARGQRLYSSDDIQRLTLIKQLVDAGYAIGSIAHLPTASLQDMRSVPESTAQTFNVGLTGTFLASLPVISALQNTRLKVIAHTMLPAEAAAAFKDAHIDAVIVEMSTLTEETHALVSRIQASCDARHAIVLYRFAPGKIIRQLRHYGFKVARASSDPSDIAALCQSLLNMPAVAAPPAPPQGLTEQPPERRFTEAELAGFLSAANNPYCECPRHLVELILSLNSFEHYSAECINRSPSDAALHRDLQRTAGHARAILENSLDRLADIEGWRGAA